MFTVSEFNANCLSDYVRLQRRCRSNCLDIAPPSRLGSGEHVLLLIVDFKNFDFDAITTGRIRKSGSESSLRPSGQKPLTKIVPLACSAVRTFFIKGEILVPLFTTTVTQPQANESAA
jgi:hypothetical protein